MARELAALKQPSPKGSIRDSGSAAHEVEKDVTGPSWGWKGQGLWDLRENNLETRDG